jgi:N-acyl-phosphatidylethanolamine-hydrolysing phospholipase D
MEHISNGSTYRIFFGGDTGFQFHTSVPEASTYPTCPAFAEVANYIGMPDLSFLPISVGASMNFVKSYDKFGLVPDIDEGLHAANHMTPQDAVRVAKIMRGAEDKDRNDLVVGRGKAVAIHWGTFVTGPEEVRNSMHDLETTCQERGVSFVRSIDERQKGDDTGQDAGLDFACLNHGQSVYLAMNSKVV